MSVEGVLKSVVYSESQCQPARLFYLLKYFFVRMGMFADAVFAGMVSANCWLYADGVSADIWLFAGIFEVEYSA